MQKQQYVNVAVTQKLRLFLSEGGNRPVLRRDLGPVCAEPRRVPEVDLLRRTFAFACRAVELYRHLKKHGGPGAELARQFLQAATSVGANEEEAQAAASKPDFISKQSIVLREARESHYWLRIFEQCGLGEPQLVHPMRREAAELVGIFTAIVKKARANQPR